MQTTTAKSSAVQDFDREHWKEREIAQRIASSEDDVDPYLFPDLAMISPGMMYRFLPIPDESAQHTEYVYLKCPEEYGLDRDTQLSHEVFVSEWNNTWEVGCLRRECLKHKIPQHLGWLAKTDVDVRLVHRTLKQSYEAYAPLFHLLPVTALKRFGLPFIRRGLWPHMLRDKLWDECFPSDFDSRLEQALSYHLWPFLGIRGKPSAFSQTDPIRMLSHNLDYWMPYVDVVAQERARAFGRIKFEDAKHEADCRSKNEKMPPGVTLQTPLYGGLIWSGEDDAEQATFEMVEIADKAGDLRAILDAVRSHRIEDDFSPHWSCEREDFERKLYSKRNKVKVTFVELDDTIPVHGPQSEIRDRLFCEDFFALLDEKERRIVVCLRNGETRMQEIAEKLGYANHSPISKRLAQVREKARRFFELD